MAKTQDELKIEVAQAALDYIAPHLRPNSILGIGTGSTANHFINLIGESKLPLSGTVASSETSAQRLRDWGIPVLELSYVDSLQFYIDGADEANDALELIKGGGAALTREKIVAAASEIFVCIADESKAVDTLGAFPLPVEVIPMAERVVMKELEALGGRPEVRESVITDNRNIIIDIHDFMIPEPRRIEAAINQITGVVCNGLFAHRGADVLLLSGQNGVTTKTR